MMLFSLHYTLRTVDLRRYHMDMNQGKISKSSLQQVLYMRESGDQIKL